MIIEGCKIRIVVLADQQTYIVGKEAISDAYLVFIVVN